MDELTRLAVKYKADKAPNFRKHSYTPYYYNLFKDKRNEIKKVLEIGVGSGASLRMWRDFFPNATIYGIDYRPERLYTEERIETLLYDQRRSNHLSSLIEKIGSDLDLVIDDGSHRPDVQIYSCTKLMPLLTKKDVLYIIEDVYSPIVAESLGKYGYEVSEPDIDFMKRFDNKLVVVGRGNKPVGITIFAKPAFRNHQGSPLKRVSSIIRGDQIAEHIGAKLNPTDGYQDDVCIYVKPPLKKGQDLTFEGNKAYLDIVDELGYLELLRNHPNVGVISLSFWNEKILKKLLPNKVVTIPQHHCNYERLRRNSKKIERVGIIGAPGAFQYLPEGLRARLRERDFELLEFSEFSQRQDIVDFYMNIDVQIVWRPYYNYKKDLLINPLKIVNASSFGIPTICYSEPAFLEMEGCYIPVQTGDEFLEELDKLREDFSLYEKYSQQCLAKAETYHIQNVSRLYKSLLA